MRQWSPEQIAIFGWFGTSIPDDRALVEAGAGCAKTSTLIEGLKYAKEHRILLTAFNKRIAEELQRQITNPNAQAKTLHGLGTGIVLRNWQTSNFKIAIDGGRGKRLAQKVAGLGTPDAIIACIAKLADLGKQMAPYAQSGHDLEDVALKMDCLPDLEWEEEGWTLERVAELAHKAMLVAKEKDGSIDFTDMIWLPLAHGWVRPAYDLVCVDEVQDLGIAQIELATRSVAKGGRAIAVGDENQAIYGFRGADSESITRLAKAWPNAKRFTLTVTRRCAKSIVKEAQQIVPRYFAAPEAKEGIVRSLARAKLGAEVQPGDRVISRKNAPLIGACLEVLRLGKRAKVEGKDIGKGLIALIRKLKGKSMPDLFKRLGVWETREIARVRAMANAKPEIIESKVMEVADRAETLRVLAEGLSGVKELEARIEGLFEDGADSGFVVFSTIHKVKGLESERAFILRNTLASGKRAGNREEMNCVYVAITRAKNELIWVEG